jgi:hypothetical protein
VALVSPFSGFLAFYFSSSEHPVAGVNLLDLDWKTLYELDFIERRRAPDGS